MAIALGPPTVDWMVTLPLEFGIVGGRRWACTGFACMHKVMTSTAMPSRCLRPIIRRLPKNCNMVFMVNSSGLRGTPFGDPLVVKQAADSPSSSRLASSTNPQKAWSSSKKFESVREAGEIYLSATILFRKSPLLVPYPSKSFTASRSSSSSLSVSLNFSWPKASSLRPLTTA